MKYDIESVKNYVENSSSCILLESEYKNNSTNMKFKCGCGEEFKTTLASFKDKNKKQCNKCSNKNSSKKQSFTYDEVKDYIEENSQCKMISREYRGIKTPLELKCDCGKIFKTHLSDFKYKNRKKCTECKTRNSIEKQKFSFEHVSNFIKENGEAKLISSEEYFKNIHSVLKFKCPCGNIFTSPFTRFKYRDQRECSDCRNNAAIDQRRLSIDDVRKKIDEVHGENQYKIIGDYKSADEKTDFLHMKCNKTFKSRAGVIIYGENGCPHCNVSKGENKIKTFLDNNNLNFKSQKRFRNLKGLGNGNLSYDFYLKKQSLLIEYQGEYHDGTARNQTDDQFEIQKEHDRRKKEYAKQNNIKLLEIWYWDFDNIDQILTKELFNK